MLQSRCTERFYCCESLLCGGLD